MSINVENVVDLENFDALMVMVNISEQRKSVSIAQMVIPRAIGVVGIGVQSVMVLKELTNNFH